MEVASHQELERAWMSLSDDDACFVDSQAKAMCGLSSHFTAYVQHNCWLRFHYPDNAEFSELPYRAWTDRELAGCLRMSARMLIPCTSPRQERLLDLIHQTIVATAAERLDARYAAQIA